MTINIGDLKQEEIRTKISIILNNEEKIVTIKNALGDKRNELLQKFEEKSKEGTEQAVLELTKTILIELTDLEVGSIEELSEVIKNPVAPLSLILHEVNEIIHELMVQHWTSQIRQLNQTSINLLSTHALKKVNEMNMLVKDLESSKKSTLQLQKELDEIVNLPIVKKKKSKGKTKKNGKNIQ